VELNFPFLRPVSWLYRAVCAFRRSGYQFLQSARSKSNVPVMVIGNITLGGTGKTPLLISIAEHFKAQGFRVGIVSRGYLGTGPFPCLVSNEGPDQVGDEPFLMAQKTGCPVAVDPSRNRAIEALLKRHSLDVILSDDGLQHYAMQRSVEIAVVDAARGFGNGYTLPAGPLREPMSRLSTVDFIVLNQTIERNNFSWVSDKKLSEKTFSMKFVPSDLVFSGAAWDLSTIKTLHVVAGIGHPERFVETLKAFWRGKGLDLPIFVLHFFDDHHAFSVGDFEWIGSETFVVMTEKDAVKVERLSLSSLQRDKMATLSIRVEIDEAFFDRLLLKLPKRGEIS
jgi:tetraacyldisaccharide 4'-kinase